MKIVQFSEMCNSTDFDKQNLINLFSLWPFSQYIVFRWDVDELLSLQIASMVVSMILYKKIGNKA